MMIKLLNYISLLNMLIKFFFKLFCSLSHYRISGQYWYGLKNVGIYFVVHPQKKWIYGFSISAWPHVWKCWLEQSKMLDWTKTNREFTGKKMQKTKWTLNKNKTRCLTFGLNSLKFRPRHGYLVAGCMLHFLCLSLFIHNSLTWMFQPCIWGWLPSI